jgi:hypothetical protein
MCRCPTCRFFFVHPTGTCLRKLHIDSRCRFG